MPTIELSTSSVSTESAGGVHAELTQQLIDYIPPSWTAPEAKRRGGALWTLLSAIAVALSSLRVLIDAARAQLRVRTATGAFLDAISRDFFGTDPATALQRRLNESDDRYRMRILAELLREKATRNGVANAVAAVTGAQPEIFEPFDVGATGAWAPDVPLQHYNASWGQAIYTGGGLVQQFNGPNAGSSPSLGVGALGDLALKYTFFVRVRSNPNAATLQEIEDVVQRVRPVGVRGIVTVSG